MHKQDEIGMSNSNPTRMFSIATIFYLLAFGRALGWLRFVLGTQGFLDTSMLVSVT